MGKVERKVSIEQCGSIVVIRMTGGGDCLWLNMYLDEERWQMTCDSDVGFYAYNWDVQGESSKPFADFCIGWFEDEDRVLRKCIGERHGQLRLNRAKSANALRREFRKDNKGKKNIEDLLEELEEVIEAADSYYDEESWPAVINEVADAKNIELPDAWWDCIVTEYTSQQNKFAEICDETIVPALEDFCNKRKAQVRKDD